MKFVIGSLLLLSNVSFAQARNASVAFQPCHSNEYAIVGTPNMIAEGVYQVPAQCIAATCIYFKTRKNTWIILREENKRQYAFESAPGDSNFQKKLKGRAREWRLLSDNIYGKDQAKNDAQGFVHQGICTKAEETTGLYMSF